MAVTNFLVSSLPAYVAQSRDLIIKNFALVGTATRTRIGLRTGIKTGEKLPFLDFGIALQDGSGCGFNPLDEAELTEKTVSVESVKHDGELCPEKLLGKYAEYLVRISATENTVPYEEYLLRVMTDEVNKVIEKIIWLGDKTNGTGNMAYVNGFLVQLGADGDVLTENILSGTTAYDGLVQVYAAMPEAALERGGVIFVSPAIYRAFLMDMVRLNYFHFAGPQNAAPEEFILPGSDVLVIKTPGLAGSLKVVGTFADNLTYLTDVEGDETDLDLWWSQDDRKFKWEAKWAMGVSYYFPDQIVLGTFAAVPSATAGQNAALAAIATNTGVIATKSAGLDNLADIKTAAQAVATNSANIKDNSTEIGNIATAAGKLAGAVNASNQIETHPNGA